MNLFILDMDPVLSAQMHCDKHVVKMILEGHILLRSALHLNDPTLQSYGWLHHPATVWTARTRENYLWVADHTIALCEEYTFRYDKIHSNAALIRSAKDLVSGNYVRLMSVGKTPEHHGVPKDCKEERVWDSYRKYYNKYKWPFAVWTKREVPEWFNPIRELSIHE